MSTLNKRCIQSSVKKLKCLESAKNPYIGNIVYALASVFRIEMVELQLRRTSSFKYYLIH
jgi:hypothetical protein